MSNTRYRVFGRQEEYDLMGMRDLIRRGEVTSLTDVAASGSNEWRGAGFYPELQRYLSLAAQQASGGAPQRPSAQAPGGRQSASPQQMLLAVILLVVGMFVGGYGLKNFYLGLSSSRWPVIHGNLLDSELVEHTRRRKGRTRRSYEARVLYSYNVDGRSYTSKRIAFGDEWFSAARAVINEVRNGPLTVHYDPKMPDHAVLHSGPTGGATMFTLLGLAALAAGGGILLAPSLASRVGGRISELSKIRLRARA